MRGDIPSVGTVSTLRFGLIFLYFFPVAVGGQRRGYDNRVYGQQQYWGQPGNRGVSPHSAFISPQFHSLTKLGREKRDGERWANPQRQKGKHWFLPVLVVGFNWEGTLVPKINGRGVQPFPPGDTPPPSLLCFLPPPPRVTVTSMTATEATTTDFTVATTTTTDTGITTGSTTGR